MKYAPKAELTPMKGLRPSGPGVEEGRISLVDQDPQQEQEAEQSNQQEEIVRENDHRQATGEEAIAFSYSCVAGCGAVTKYGQKPTRLSSGQWPKVRCVACGKLVRI